MQKINFKSYELKKGSHKSVEDGLCAMEMVSYLAKEKHSDAPTCACPALTKFVVRLNDIFTDVERQRLKPFLKKLIGTRDSDTLNRAKEFAHAAITIFAPIALESRGFNEHASKLRAVKFGDWEEGRKLARYAASATSADAAAYYAADAASDAAYFADASASAAAYYAADAATATPDSRKTTVDNAIAVLSDCLKKYPAKKSRRHRGTKK